MSPQPNDPWESTNRRWFDTNIALADAVMPSASAPSAEAPAVTPPPGRVLRALRNAGRNLGAPSRVFNDLLQLRPQHAMQNTLRFAINSTVGLAGIFDPATRLGLPGRETDFGETLHRWGMGEGAYVMLPVIGPTTERDMLGMVVDQVLNPWDLWVSGPERRAITGVRLGGRFASMAESAEALDANVMGSADPYAQARLLFLQARRHHLGIQTEDDSFDPYDMAD